MDSQTPLPAEAKEKGWREGRFGLPSGAVVWIAAYWMWTLPSALFWALAEQRNIFLPYLPRFLWSWPGEVWRAIPWLFVILSVAVPCLIVAGARRWPKPAKITRVLAYALIVIIGLIHVLWGGAILSL